MFTYIKLKNFLSFGDVTFNFKKNAKTAKSLIAIYGENGSGKSNFVRCFDFLDHTLMSLTMDRKTESLADLLREEKSASTNEVIQRILRETSSEQNIASCRMAECEEPTEIEFGFLLNGHEGYYRLVFTEKIIKETLYYYKEKQSGKLFEISLKENETISHKFWSGLFLNRQTLDEYTLDIQKYWGKHTFLSMFVQKSAESNADYTAKTVSRVLLDIIGMFMNTTVALKGQKSTRISMSQNMEYALPSLSSGEIPATDLPKIKLFERILKEFFPQAYADIKDVSYKYTKVAKKKFRYQLFVDKMIAGELRHISFQNESTGTERVLSIFQAFLGLFDGTTIVYDEIDTGIHDLLMSAMIESLPDDMPGQLIFTTHNTMLLEKLDDDSLYVIDVDYQGNKEVHCLAEFPVQKNHNMRLQYLKGLYGGTPFVEEIDYRSIISEFHEQEADT